MTNTAKFWNKHAGGCAKRPVGDEAAGLEIEERWQPGPAKALFVIARKQ